MLAGSTRMPSNSLIQFDYETIITINNVYNNILRYTNFYYIFSLYQSLVIFNYNSS